MARTARKTIREMEEELKKEEELYPSFLVNPDEDRATIAKALGIPNIKVCEVSEEEEHEDSRS